MPRIEDIIRHALANPNSITQSSDLLREHCFDADYTKCRKVVASLKFAIKDNATEVSSKLVALELIHCCVMSQSRGFLAALGSKLISRLSILACHRLQSEDLDKGKDLFGKLSTSSYANQQASVLFLQRLLTYFPLWAEAASIYEDRESIKICAKFADLKVKGLKFLKLESELGLSEEIEMCYRAIRRLSSAIYKGSKDSSKLAKRATRVLDFKAKLDIYIEKLGQTELVDPAQVDMLINANEAIADVIFKYETYKIEIDNPEVSDVEDLSDAEENIPRQPIHIAKGLKNKAEVFEEEVKQAFKDPMPSHKPMPQVYPRSPRSAKKIEFSISNFCQEQAIIEANLKQVYDRSFETGTGAIEEAYHLLVSATQQLNCDEFLQTIEDQRLDIRKLGKDLEFRTRDVEGKRQEVADLTRRLKAAEDKTTELAVKCEIIACQGAKIAKYKEKIKILKQNMETLNNEIKALKDSKFDSPKVPTSPKPVFNYSLPMERFSIPVKLAEEADSMSLPNTPHVSHSANMSMIEFKSERQSPTHSEVNKTWENVSGIEGNVLDSIELLQKTPAFNFSNMEGFANGCCYDTAIIYEDSFVQIGFKHVPTDNIKGVVWLYLGNKSQSSLTDLDYQLISPQGLTSLLSIEGRREQSLIPRQKQDFKVTYRLTKIFKSAPVFQVSFSAETHPMSLSLKMPLVISRFLTPCNLLSQKNFDIKWATFPQEFKQSLVLRSSIKSLEELIVAMRLAGHFKVFTEAVSLEDCIVISAAYSGKSAVLVRLDLTQSLLKVTGRPHDLVESTMELMQEVLEARSFI